MLPFFEKLDLDEHFLQEFRHFEVEIPPQDHFAFSVLRNKTRAPKKLIENILEQIDPPKLYFGEIREFFDGLHELRVLDRV